MYYLYDICLLAHNGVHFAICLRYIIVIRRMLLVGKDLLNLPGYMRSYSVLFEWFVIAKSFLFAEFWRLLFFHSVLFLWIVVLSVFCRITTAD